MQRWKKDDKKSRIPETKLSSQDGMMEFQGLKCNFLPSELRINKTYVYKSNFKSILELENQQFSLQKPVIM